MPPAAGASTIAAPACPQVGEDQEAAAQRALERVLEDHDAGRDSVEGTLAGLRLVALRHPGSVAARQAGALAERLCGQADIHVEGTGVRPPSASAPSRPVERGLRTAATGERATPTPDGPRKAQAPPRPGPEPEPAGVTAGTGSAPSPEVGGEGPGAASTATDPLERVRARMRELMGDNTGQVPWGQARVVTSRFYRLRTNVGPEQARFYAQMLDAYFLKFARVFDVRSDRVMAQRVEQVARRKFEVWIYGGHDEFMARESQPPGVGGFYSPSLKRIVAFHGYEGPDWNTCSTLVHEGCHQFQDMALGNIWNAPVWLIEGYATFFEGAVFDGEDVRIGAVPRARLAGLKRAVETEGHTPLAELIRMPQREFTAMQYGEAWSLIYMIVYGNDDDVRRRRNQRLFSHLFFGARKGPIRPEQVEALFGGAEGLAAFEEEWRHYVLALSPDHDPAGGRDR